MLPTAPWPWSTNSPNIPSPGLSNSLNIQNSQHLLNHSYKNGMPHQHGAWLNTSMVSHQLVLAHPHASPVSISTLNLDGSTLPTTPDSWYQLCISCELIVVNSYQISPFHITMYAGIMYLSWKLVNTCLLKF